MPMPKVSHIRSQVKKQVLADMRRAKQLRLSGWSILTVVVGTFPCALLFDHFGKLNLLLPVMSCGMSLFFVAFLKWNFRQRGWFWGVMIAATAANAVLLKFVSWPTKWVPGVWYAGIASLDVYVLLAVVALVSQLIRPTADQNNAKFEN